MNLKALEDRVDALEHRIQALIRRKHCNDMVGRLNTAPATKALPTKTDPIQIATFDC